MTDDAWVRAPPEPRVLLWVPPDLVENEGLRRSLNSLLKALGYGDVDISAAPSGDTLCNVNRCVDNDGRCGFNDCMFRRGPCDVNIAPRCPPRAD